MSEHDEPHPYYGPCDAFGPNMECSECVGLLECNDGSVIDKAGNVVKRAPLITRLQAAWRALTGD